MAQMVQSKIYYLDDFDSFESAVSAWRRDSQTYHYFDKNSLQKVEITSKCHLVDLNIDWMKDDVILHLAPWNDNQWTITHVTTGVRVSHGSTRFEAITKAVNSLKKIGLDGYNDNINKFKQSI